MKHVIEQLQQVVSSQEDKIAKATKERWARIERAFVDGDVVPPTRDKHGRLHSPCDGYYIPDALCRLCEIDYSDRKFGAGEYLPMPFDNDDLLLSDSYDKEIKFRYEHRVKVKLTTFKLLESIETRYLSLERGKIWESCGVQYCMCYMKADYKEFFNAVSETISEISKLEMAAEKEGRGEAPEGRVTVVAKIIGLPCKASDYGYNNVDYKLSAQLENGSTVYGTLPTSLYHAEIGDTVEFTATFSRAEGDSTHSFYKRPSNATTLEVTK